MKRRTLLKGAGAAGALAIGGARRMPRLSAQAPGSYQLTDVTMFDTYVFENDYNWYGALRGIANDGTMVGDTVLDGILYPMLWAPDGTMTVLDTSSAPGMHIAGSGVNSLGQVVGEATPIGMLQIGVDNSDTYLWWEDFVVPAAGPAYDPGALVAFVNLSESGIVTGQLNSQAVRWDANVPTLLDNAGSVSSGTRAVSPGGSIGGTLWSAIDGSTAGTPATWSPDGVLTQHAQPYDFVPYQQRAVRIMHLNDDGSFVLTVFQNEGYPTYVLRYAVDGTQTPIAGLSTEGHSVYGGTPTGMLYGSSQVNGIQIPTVWYDDQPVAVADLIVPGPDRVVTQLYDANDSGSLVAMAVDSAGVQWGVLLDPV